jgi:hypothetical protein
LLDDVVIDTNVLLHADDPRQPHQADAYALLQELVASGTALCVDEGFDVDESRNASLIGGEYFQRLTATNTATAVLAHMFASGRVKLVKRRLPDGARKAINQCVRTKRDRTFLAVTRNSADRVLCSHDFEDMQDKKRAFLTSKLGIDVVKVDEARARL